MDGGAVTATVIFSPSASTVDSCRAGGRYAFRVAYGRSSGQPGELPLELAIGLEPSVTGSAGPAAATGPVTFAAPHGTAHKVAGGGSFSAAAVLTGSGNYTDVLQNTEYVYYRVKLGWGQGLAYRVTFGAASDWESGDDANIGTAVYAPFRADVASATSTYRGAAQALPTDDTAVRTLPVRYRNRQLHDDRQRATSVAGWYCLSVKLGRQDAHPSAEHPVSVRIALAVVGTARPGPSYARTTAAPSADADRSAAAAATTRTGFPVAAVIGGVGAVVVVAGAATGIVLATRRRRTRPGPFPPGGQRQTYRPER
jgi:Ca-activated chloride channel family protein